MAYVSGNPPRLLVRKDNGIGIWSYSSPDDAAAVKAANYFSNGANVGMRPGDLVMQVIRSPGSPPTIGLPALLAVSAISAGGAATVI